MIWEGASMFEKFYSARTTKPENASSCLGTSCLLISLVILILFLLSSGALAQDVAFTTRLTPWPPEGWSEGAKGEVHAATVTANEGLVTIFIFPIGERGEVTYRLGLF